MMAIPVALQPAIDRIAAGQMLPYRNDGSIFMNRELLLAPKPDGYYREYVHPTPGTSGPGGQRIVVGQGGDMDYTSDHDRSFTPIA
jgi:filamentous hemagglutinin